MTPVSHIIPSIGLERKQEIGEVDGVLPTSHHFMRLYHTIINSNNCINKNDTVIESDCPSQNSLKQMPPRPTLR